MASRKKEEKMKNKYGVQDAKVKVEKGGEQSQKHHHHHHHYNNDDNDDGNNNRQLTSRQHPSYQFSIPHNTSSCTINNTTTSNKNTEFYKITILHSTFLPSKV